MRCRMKNEESACDSPRQCSGMWIETGYKCDGCSKKRNMCKQEGCLPDRIREGPQDRNHSPLVIRHGIELMCE